MFQLSDMQVITARRFAPFPILTIIYKLVNLMDLNNFASAHILIVNGHIQIHPRHAAALGQAVTSVGRRRAFRKYILVLRHSTSFASSLPPG